MPTRPCFALDYQKETKHPELSVRASAHNLDWENKPSPFKVYRDLPSIPLPQDSPHPKAESLAAVKGGISETRKNRVDLGTVAELLFFLAGLTRGLPKLFR